MKRAIKNNQSHENNLVAGFIGLVKTKNLSLMKTKNNVQKAVLRFAAVVVSFILISYTVSAQDFWKRFLENSSFGHIAMVMADSNDSALELNESASTDVAFFFEPEMEAGLEMESWMTDESTFALSLNFEQESDKIMELESWMLDQNLFQTTNETESTLELEAWMVSDDVWNI